MRRFAILLLVLMGCQPVQGSIIRPSVPGRAPTDGAAPLAIRLTNLPQSMGLDVGDEVLLHPALMRSDGSEQADVHPQWQYEPQDVLKIEGNTVIALREGAVLVIARLDGATYRFGVIVGGGKEADSTTPPTATSSTAGGGSGGGGGGGAPPPPGGAVTIVNGGPAPPFGGL